MLSRIFGWDKVDDREPVSTAEIKMQGDPLAKEWAERQAHISGLQYIAPHLLQAEYGPHGYASPPYRLFTPEEHARLDAEYGARA